LRAGQICGLLAWLSFKDTGKFDRHLGKTAKIIHENLADFSRFGA
jgi:hypothetical protein